MKPRTRGPLHCIVGMGNVGRLHGATLSSYAVPFVAVDPNPTIHGFRSLDEIPRTVRDQVGIWHVCTPTSLHIDNIRHILGFDDCANLLIEKPVCQPDQLPEMKAMLASCPRARVVINEQYRYSSALRWLRSTRDSSASVGPVKIEVEMTKNRHLDAVNGRFVDSRLGVLGYEWPHLTTALSVLLTRDEFDALLATPGVLERTGTRDDWPPSTASETVRLPKDVEVTLCSSVEGRILLRDDDAFSAYGLTASDDAGPVIPMHESLRYRIARIRTTHWQAKVVYEPRSVLSKNARNFHLCLKSTDARQTEMFVESNHFAMAIVGAKTLLSDDRHMSHAVRSERLRQHFSVQERLRAMVATSPIAAFRDLNAPVHC